MPDISDISKKSSKSGKGKSPGSGSRSKSTNVMNLSLSSALETAMLERPSRPTPTNRPLPFISEALSETRTRKLPSGKNVGKSMEETSSAASSPAAKKHTPATIPRTKFTSATPLEQRIAISKLKQRLEFTGNEEDSSVKQESIERDAINNESAAAASAVLYDQASLSSMTESIGTNQFESETSDMVDMSRILQRLNQVRDYLKQATSMYVSLSTKDEMEESEVDHIDKLGKLIQQLRIQEQGYVDLLQRTLDMDQSANLTPSSSVMSLKQSEIDDGEDSQQELNKLKMQHSLLKKIVDQQQQIQDLKKKQSTLAALQEQAEEMMKAAEIDETEIPNLPNNLRLNQLQNMASALHNVNSTLPGKRMISQDTEPPVDEVIDNEEAALLDADMVQKKLELENKLMSLQSKKEKMDVLLKTLKSSRDALGASGGIPLMQQAQQSEQMASNNPANIRDLLEAASRNNQAITNQQELYQVEDVQEKLRKLKEVKQRLEDLGQIVSEYEHAQSGQLLPTSLTGNQKGNASNQAASKAQAIVQPASHGGTRPRNQNKITEEFSDGLDNRMRPAPPGGRFLRPAIDVTRNQSSAKEPTIPQNIDAILASEKNLAAGSQDEDLTSKIRQLQEAKQRLASAQRNFKMPLQQDRVSKGLDDESQSKSEATTVSESESESESVSTAEDLSWQDDPEFQAKVRRLQHAKEKLKHLQDLVNSAQLDGISMDELANISLSSKASSEYDKEEKEEDDEEEEEDSSDEEDETATEQDSQANIEDEVDEEDDDVSVEQASRQMEKNEESDASNLDQAAALIDRELGYQLRLSQQKKELEKLLKEKQKLLEAQRQLSEIARGAFVSKEEEEYNVSKEKEEKSPRANENAKKEPEKKQNMKNENATNNIREPPKTEKAGLRVTYKDLKVPRIVKRISNLSVEPQFGSDSDLRTKRNKAVAQANKKQAAGSRPSNPLVMSELRRQREMFEQNKKLKFVEKQRRKRDSGDDRSDGGTYSIRSDIDEGVGVSMFSADVTTAATWGGSTEQSSTEEDSAVDEDDYPEGEEEIEDDYEENIDQPEEEEEEGIVDEESEEDDVPPLFDFKKKHKKQKIEKPELWFNVDDQRDKRRGKKRKLDFRRSDTNRGSSVSWSMNVSPEAPRNRRRQQNLTPAHKLMRNRTSRPRDETSNTALEDQCEQLRQQLSNSTAFSTTLLTNQQTLLTMLQNQFAAMNDARGHGFPSSGYSQQNVFGEPRAFQSPFAQSQLTQQRSNQILQALNRCTSQLDRQCQDIQHLQREFQNMVVNPLSSGRQRVYPWENPSPLNVETGYNPSGLNDLFKTSTAAQNDPFINSGLFQQQYTNSPGLRYKPGLTHSATSPHAFLDDTQHRFTQTEIPADIATTNVNHSYSLFSEHNDSTGNQVEKKPTDFSPFRFYDLQNASNQEGQEFFPISSAGYNTGTVSINRSLNQETNEKYDPLAYTDASAGPIFSDNRATGVSSDVITTSYPTPSKSVATRNLAERQKATWPSFLKETEQFDTASERTVSQYEDSEPRRGVNIEAANERRRLEKETANEDNMERMSVASNFSLFETMRDSIYSEVATLISMNESRPHYLVELFRELQLLTSDYLRQRALYSLQDLVTRFLTEDSETRQSNDPPEEVYQSWIGTAAAEHTPSESVATTADEDEQESKALEALSSQIRNNDMYDYAEIAETGSTRSTPTSNQDPPFAAEGLGDTVINLDEALQNMRSYEEKMSEARRNALEENDQATPKHSLVYSAAVAASDSSAYDVNSEASSDIQQPSIDTQKLDRQIKAIMLELIPFLNEHMEAQCTSSFLSELRSLILKLAKEKEPDAEKQEFGRSFHRQLESVLKDSLSKFEGRSLKECGEDVLIDISEILFNELAFFRLMQDLDRPMSRQPGFYWKKDSDTDGYIAAVANENEEVTEFSSERESAKSFENGQSIGYLVNTTGTLFSPPAPRQAESTPKRNIFEDQLMVEDIEENGCSDAEDETEASRQFVNVELSVSESRPVASTGSGEEDVEEDQQNFPEHHLATESSVSAHQQAELAASSDAAESDDVDNIDEMPEDEEQRISPLARLSEDRNSSAEPAEDEREEDVRDEVAQREEEERAVVDSTDDGARAGIDRNSEDTEDNEITVDDLPTKLTGLTEADLQTRMESEQQANEGANGVLAHLEQNDELAEDSGSIPQPEQPQDESSTE